MKKHWLLLLRYGAKRRVCGRSGLVCRALTEDDCANVQVCRDVVLQCALCNGDVLAAGVQAGRAEQETGVNNSARVDQRRRQTAWLQEKGKCAGCAVARQETMRCRVVSIAVATKHTQVRAVWQSGIIRHLGG